MFTAHHIPMITTLARCTADAVKQNEHVTTALACMANSCQQMIKGKKYASCARPSREVLRTLADGSPPAAACCCEQIRLGGCQPFVCARHGRLHRSLRQRRPAGRLPQQDPHSGAGEPRAAALLIVASAQSLHARLSGRSRRASKRCARTSLTTLSCPTRCASRPRRSRTRPLASRRCSTDGHRPDGLRRAPCGRLFAAARCRVFPLLSSFITHFCAGIHARRRVT
jgi:hypothetical protein